MDISEIINDDIFYLEHNANIYFWFFPAQKPDPSSPLIIWLQVIRTYQTI